MKKEKLKILACPANEGGCAYYRIILPMNKLAELHGDEVEVRFDSNPLGWDLSAMQKAQKPGLTLPDWTDENLKWADVVFTQNIHNFGGPYTFELCRTAAAMGKLTHFDNDDLLTELYSGHRLYDAYVDNKLAEITKQIYSFVDIVSVTQRKFAERIAPYVGRALVIIKNSIDYNLECWNAVSIPPSNKRVTRLGWVGGIHHEEDVKEFPGVMLSVNAKVGPENVHWGFYGRPPLIPNPETGEIERDWQQDVWDNYEKHLKSGARHKNHRVYSALPAEKYGLMYTNIDVAIAPLQMNPFNDSKSEIKVAECGRYGVPLVASDVGCYDETITNGVTGYLISPDNPRAEWTKILRKIIKDKKHRVEMGQNLKVIVDEHFDINKNVRGRVNLYREIMKTKEEVMKRGSHPTNTDAERGSGCTSVMDGTLSTGRDVSND